MKKIIVFILCAVITLSFTACSNNSPSKDSTQKQTTGDNAQIPNPFVDCKTIADANKIAGFTVVTPKTLPTGYSQDTIRAIKDDLVEIIYVKGENKISFRQGKDSKDISGDYNEYKESNTLTIGSLQVTIKGDNGEVNLAVWTDGDYAYAISSEGLDNNTISDMITSMKSDADDNVQIPNPFIDCATMADAKKTADFTLTVPSKMPKGYVQELIQATENDMVQVFYKNGEKEILIRKTKGTEDISGDYNEYKENNTITIGSLKVSTKGNDGKINTATWVDGEYTYSITANLGETGLDTTTINEMVSDIH